MVDLRNGAKVQDARNARDIASPDAPDVAAAWPSQLRRVVICIGAQKASTSFLFVSLAADGRVCVPPVKEVHFWDTFEGVGKRRFRRRARSRFLRNLRRDGWPALRRDGAERRKLVNDLRLARLRHMGGRGIGAYRDFLLTNYDGQEIVFEASPGYALCPQETLFQMANVGPDTKLLLIMRDPVDRLWSASKYIWRQRLESGKATKEEILAHFLSRVRDKDSVGYRHSQYDRTIDAIERAGQIDKLAVLFYETLSSPAEQAVLSDLVGFTPSIDFGRKVNTHQSHVAVDESALAEAVDAFAPTYAAIRARFANRVPAEWLGS